MVKRYTLIISVIIFGAIVYKAFAYSGGGIAGNTDAPSESNCTSCHSGTLNSGSYLSNLLFTPNFSGGGYIPDSTYTMSVAFKEPGRKRYGFQITCLDEATNTKQGNFAVVSGGRVQVTTTSISGKTRQYVEHTSTGNSQTSTDSIYWQFKWTAPNKNVGKVKFYVVVNATNSSGDNTGDRIYGKSFSYGLSSLLPKADAQCLDSISCTGYSVRFVGVGTQSPTSYNWTFPGGTPSSSTAKNPTVSYSSSGIKMAILTVKNVYGTSAPDTFKNIVNASPNISYSGKTLYTICPGDSVKLTVSSTSPGASFRWMPGNKAGASLIVKDTGTYYAIAKGTNTCEKNSVQITVRHKAKPLVVLSTNPAADTVCNGTAVTLNASSATPDSFFYYNSGSLLNKSKSASYINSHNSNAGYYVIVKDTNGCFSDKSNIKTIAAKAPVATPVINCQPGTTSSLTFDWPAVPSALGYEVSIDSGSNWIAPSSGNNGTTHTINGLLPDTRVRVRLRAKDVAPCFYSVEASAVCQSAPCSNISFDIQSDSLVCKGSPAVIRLTGLYDDKYATSFNGAALSKDTVFNVTPAVSTNYKIEVKDSNSLGCPNIVRFVPVEVESTPVKPVAINQSICKGDNVTITVSKAKKHSFLYNSTVLYSGSDSSYTFVPAGNGAVIVHREFRICKDTLNYGNITVKRMPDAGFTYSNNHYDYTFKAKDVLATDYKWSFSDTISINGDTISRNMLKFKLKPVKVILEVSDFGGCSNKDSVSFTVADYSSLNKLSADLNVKVYPNPASSILNIELSQDLEQYTLSLSSIDGRIVKTLKTSGNRATLQTEDLAPGTYMLQLSNSRYRFRQAIIVK